MKQAIFILSVAVILLGVGMFYTNKKKNAYKSDLRHLKKTVDRTVAKKVNDAKRHVTDSLLKEFNSRPHDTIVKTKIQTKYDTLYYPILNSSANKQYKQSKHELDSIYAN